MRIKEMNVIIKDADVFRRIINCLKDLITDSGEFILDSRGISMQSTDTSKVVMIDILLEQDAFGKYELEDEKTELKLPLNFVNFSNILKLSKSAQIGMVHKKDSDKVTLKLTEHNNRKVQFNMNLATVDKEQLEVDEIDYCVKVYVDVSEFQKSIKDLSSFGKKCKIAVNANELILSVVGDAGDGEISVSDIEIEYLETTDENEEFSGVFNAKYLNFFAKAGLSNEIILKFANGVPFCFEYQLEYGYVRFYLSQMTVDD
jgi:proliferating cell nuclear antigen